jgi:UDP-N-acetylmuramyl pentapeptide phosphotransferase/UDP-N-acetylglucosamine-1-phosphate transferase
MTITGLPLMMLALLAAALLSAAITWAIRPMLLRHALARPNARSSHRIPTPQGAGIAVIAATLLVAGAIMLGAGTAALNLPTAVVAATLFIAVVGFADDVKSIGVLPRLLLQGAAVAAIVWTAPDNMRIVPACPLWIERGMLLVAGLWFVNLVNFMDGLDWMTVAETVPITAAMLILGTMSDYPASATLLAAALLGAMLGFAPFNRPVAKVFLGDVGSLPIGLLLGWCLLQLAYAGQFAAALLLPMYYLFDATATLLRRMARREPFWAAHRTHFYQRATDNGFTVWRVVGEVYLLNVVLASLAIGSAMTSHPDIKIVCVIVGGVAAGTLALRFARGRNPS